MKTAEQLFDEIAKDEYEFNTGKGPVLLPRRGMEKLYRMVHDGVDPNETYFLASIEAKGKGNPVEGIDIWSVTQFLNAGMVGRLSFLDFARHHGLMELLIRGRDGGSGMGFREPKAEALWDEVKQVQEEVAERRRKDHNFAKWGPE